MKHDHVLRKLDFDLLTPSPMSGVCVLGGGGGVGGYAGKIFANILLHCDCIYFDMHCDHVLVKLNFDLWTHPPWSGV